MLQQCICHRQKWCCIIEVYSDKEWKLTAFGDLETHRFRHNRALRCLSHAYHYGVSSGDLWSSDKHRALYVLFFLPCWHMFSTCCIGTYCQTTWHAWNSNIIYSMGVCAFQEARTTHHTSLLKKQVGLISTNTSNHHFLKQNLCESLLKVTVLILA